MHRFIKKWEENGQKLLERHPHFDLSIRELEELYKDGNRYDVLWNAFRFGIECGARMSRLEHDTVTPYDKLVMIANLLNVDVSEIDFKFFDGLLKDDRIGISDKLPEDKKPFILAHEIAHALLHSKRGDLVHNPDPQAEKDADVVAQNLLDCLNDR